MLRSNVDMRAISTCYAEKDFQNHIYYLSPSDNEFDDPYALAMAGFCQMLLNHKSVKEYKEVGETVASLFTYCPMALFYMVVVQPYKKSGHIVPDRFINEWAGAYKYGEPTTVFDQFMKTFAPKYDYNDYMKKISTIHEEVSIDASLPAQMLEMYRKYSKSPDSVSNYPAPEHKYYMDEMVHFISAKVNDMYDHDISGDEAVKAFKEFIIKFKELSPGDDPANESRFQNKDIAMIFREKDKLFSSAGPVSLFKSTDFLRPPADPDMFKNKEIMTSEPIHDLASSNKIYNAEAHRKANLKKFNHGKIRQRDVMMIELNK